MISNFLGLRPLWPCGLWPCSLCDLDENWYAFQVGKNISADQISSNLVQKWLRYSTITVSAMAFYLLTLQGCGG